MPYNKKRKEKQHGSTVDGKEEHPEKPKGDKDFFYFSVLAGSIANDDDIWLVESDASRHMIEQRGNIYSILEKRLSQRVELEDNHNYVVKGVGKASIELESSNNMRLTLFYMYQA